MVSREIIEVTSKLSETSKAMEPIVKEVLDKRPDIDYTKIDEDTDPEIVRSIVASKPPSVHPTFIGLKDGKFNATISGSVSKEDLEFLVD